MKRTMRGVAALMAATLAMMGGSLAAQTPGKGDKKLDVFKTAKGRTVFGGGGITPDIKIAYTRKFTDLQAKLEREQIFGDVASKLANSKGMKKSDDFETFLKSWQAGDDLVSQVRTVAEARTMADGKKIAAKDEEWKTETGYIKQALKREVARTVWGDEQRYRVAIQDDEMMSQAITHFPEAVLMAKNNEGATPAQR